jgi:hypothetical protein
MRTALAAAAGRDVRSWMTDPPPASFAGLPPLTRWDARLTRLVPIVFALSTGFQVTKYVVAPVGIGFDAKLYAQAARDWLAGSDPWSTSSFGIRFGAPPPTLLVSAPFAALPDQLLVPLAVMGSFLLAALAIRALALPMWWLAFWPIVDGCMVGNLNIAVFATLVILGRRLDVLAPLLKIYAVVPLVADRRMRSLLIVGLVLAVTFPFLPWAHWWEAQASIASGLAASAQGTSVYGNLLLMIVGATALLSLGIRRAGWLAVPVLWPWTQIHYMAMSVPALTPTLAIVWALPRVPPTIVLSSVVVVALGMRFRPMTLDRPAATIGASS